MLTIRQCPTLNNNKIKHISEIKADIKLCTRYLSVVTFPVFFSLGQVIF